MLGSEGVVRLKMASASRCRDGAEGAVNWKTAGPVRATLLGVMGGQLYGEETVGGRGRAGEFFAVLRLPDAVGHNRVVDLVSRMLVLWSSLVESGNLLETE